MRKSGVYSDQKIKITTIHRFFKCQRSNHRKLYDSLELFEFQIPSQKPTENTKSQDEICPKLKLFGKIWEDNKQDARPLSGYFAPTTIVTDVFLKVESVSSSKYSVFSAYFLSFPTLNFYGYVPKNLKIKVEWHFQEEIPFKMHYRKKLVTCCDL